MQPCMCNFAQWTQTDRLTDDAEQRATQIAGLVTAIFSNNACAAVRFVVQRTKYGIADRNDSLPVCTESRKSFVNLARQDPGRARQSS